MKNMRYIILAGSIFNIACGILVIFFLNYVAPLVDFDPLGNMLFTLFVGGTAITFGIGYYNVFRNPAKNLSFLYYGAGIKYWAFLIGVYCFLYHDLSLPVLIIFGVMNLVFAISFTIYIFSKRKPIR